MARGQTTFYANLGITPRPPRVPGAKATFDLTLCTYINGHPHVVVTADELAWIGQTMIQLAGKKAPVEADDDDDGMDLI